MAESGLLVKFEEVHKLSGKCNRKKVLYPDSGISMDEEIVLGDMIWSYNKAEL